GAMKDWAIERGATHFTHWFQPMTGITAEKHDSFISPIPGGKVMMEFSGKELIKGESDASSFPSGGLRATFEARGYTAWDCTSPAFLKEDATGVILCIPTAFCAYTGEALDKKTPLLRSLEAIDREATRLMHLFGYEDVHSVSCSVGPEQEYFLIDHEKYMQREDLMLTGRTLFGAPAPKGQELDDHYFGTIKERIGSYMKELNEELWKLGILAKTQHNEVAPGQHELAPIYSTATISTDHNQLVMETMKKVANRHGLNCLLHEKPFAGVNGSGKHDNWSLLTDTGINLLKPGRRPHENLLFLFVLSAVIRAVDEHAGLLRLSASNPGNDHRLGANEAPPAIISMFIGEQLEDILAQILETGTANSSKRGGRLNIGVHTLPELRKDATDRNRTSPFAFTGNKFEFRMVGSSMSIADANTVLNTIVADALSEMCDELEKAENFEDCARDLIRRNVTEHQRIIFNGDGYSQAWVEEAARRGLPNYPSFVDAIPCLVDEKSVRVFEKFGVLNEAELHSRTEILYESYSKCINIEAKTMIDMASKLYIPSVIGFITSLANSINAVQAAVPGLTVDVQTELLTLCSELLKDAQKELKELCDLDSKAATITDTAQRARFFRYEVFPQMARLREPIDKLENIVDKEFWPVPQYKELMFEV
ncbi:MAG: glutamine synthetase III, partial [Lachnospiraceae bacterium]|nr:glutamine synthetase III [Lachnospiraceae bacterium]